MILVSAVGPALFWRLSILILALLGLMPQNAFAGSLPQVEVALFSEAKEGMELPDQWEPMTFPKIPRHTEYQVVTEDSRTVVKAISDGSASGLIRKIEIDLKETPVLKWRWKVPNVVAGSDVHSKDGDDYAARLYVTFEYDPDAVSFSKKAKYKIGKLLFGDIPIAAINYVWENNTEIGTIISSSYTDFSKMVVVGNKDARLGEWVEEERNVYEDYMKAFDEEPPKVNGIAIMTDTDNTGGTATTFYGDISFEKSAPLERMP